jgi:hypothetical protein
MLEAKEHATTLYPFVVFTFRLIVEPIKEFRGASHTFIIFIKNLKFHSNSI